jgi:hypothetical protein
MEFRKTANIPNKVNIEEQEDFKKNFGATNSRREVWRNKNVFSGCSTLFYGAFRGYLWSFDRVFVKTGSCRQRFNVLGAYDPINQK